MPTNFLEDTYRAAMDQYDVSIQEAELNFRRAQAVGDVAGAAAASQDRAALLVQAEKYHQQATQHAATLRAPQQGNRYGLSQDEIDVAKASGITDEEYAQHKNRYQHMKATGQYSTDQGKVFK